MIKLLGCLATFAGVFYVLGNVWKDGDHTVFTAGGFGFTIRILLAGIAAILVWRAIK